MQVPPPAIPALPMTPIDNLLNGGNVSSSDLSSSSPSPSMLDTMLPPPVVDHLPAPTKRSNPGPLERCDQEIQRVLRIDTFDGAKVELQKVLGPNFVTSHSLQMGSSAHEKGSFYSFSSTLVLNDTLLIGRVDHNQRVEAQWHQPFFNKQYNSRVQMQISPKEGAQGMVDLERRGDTQTLGLKLGVGLLGVSGFQAVTPRIAVGAEAMHVFRMSQTMVSGRVRYTDNNHLVVGTVNQASSCVSFLRRVSNRVGLACEVEVAHANLNSHMHFGTEFTMRQAKLMTNITSTGVIQATLQDVVGPSCFLLLSAFVDHRNDLYRFGVGIQLG